MKSYRGFIDASDGRHVVVDDNALPDNRSGHAINPRHDLFNHSPEGFAWGYSGSGPAQLALAILADHLGDDAKAVKLHHQFKFRVIAQLDIDKPFALTAREIDRTLAEMAPAS